MAGTSEELPTQIQEEFRVCKTANCNRPARSMFKGHCCWHCGMKHKREAGGSTAEGEWHGPWCLQEGDWIPPPGPTNTELGNKIKMLQEDFEKLKYEVMKITKNACIASIICVTIVTIVALKKAKN